jgi:hypothetical protein
MSKAASEAYGTVRATSSTACARDLPRGTGEGGQTQNHCAWTRQYARNLSPQTRFLTSRDLTSAQSTSDTSKAILTALTYLNRLEIIPVGC